MDRTSERSQSPLYTNRVRLASSDPLLTIPLSPPLQLGTPQRDSCLGQGEPKRCLCHWNTSQESEPKGQTFGSRGRVKEDLNPKSLDPKHMGRVRGENPPTTPPPPLQTWIVPDGMTVLGTYGHRSDERHDSRSVRDP